VAFYWLEGGSKHIRHSTEPSGEEARDAKKSAYAKSETDQTRRIALVASDIMRSPVRTLPASATFDEAKALFKQSRFRHVPILNGTKLCGIISDRDVLKEAAQTTERLHEWVSEFVSEQKTVDDFMTKRVLVGTPNTGIRLIARAMFEERIGSMPIVDEKLKLVGIITRSDILRTLVSHAPIELWI